MDELDKLGYGLSCGNKDIQGGGAPTREYYSPFQLAVQGRQVASGCWVALSSQNAGLKTIAALSGCKEKERKEVERKQSFSKGNERFSSSESTGENLDPWPVIPLREAGKCGFHLGS